MITLLEGFESFPRYAQQKARVSGPHAPTFTLAPYQRSMIEQLQQTREELTKCWPSLALYWSPRSLW